MDLEGSVQDGETWQLCSKVLDHQIQMPIQIQRHDNQPYSKVVDRQIQIQTQIHSHLDKRDHYPTPDPDEERLKNMLHQGRLVNITGDVLLASGVVAYLGAFDARYRKTMISDWQVMMMTMMI